jgi:2-polyprenyl-6-methoxyphenol hydroxylase-like FAD-dependent oxidoreductase
VSQVETEQSLEEVLRERYGVEVEWSTRAGKIEQDGDGVTVELENEATGKTETVRARYVVGGDGAHSVVRHASKLKFEGGAYPQEFILADLHVDWPGDTSQMQHRLNLFMDKGLMLIFPLADNLVRVVLSQPSTNEEPDTEGAAAGLNVDAAPKIEVFQEALRTFYPGEMHVYDPVWLAKFRLHHRGVDSYRDGRLFVAGDAAHIHSPAGGQGMNTGIQDAINLAWKLATVIRSQKKEKESEGEGEGDNSNNNNTYDAAAADKLLDTYNEERRPVGQAVLKSTDKLYSWASWANPIWVAVRNVLLPWILPRASSDPVRQAKGFQFISQFGIEYRKSSLVHQGAGFKGPVCAGDRAPDAPMRHADGSKGHFMDLCVAGYHHLVLFAGSGNGNENGAGSNAVGVVEKLEEKKSEFLRTAKEDRIKVHYLFAEDKLAGRGSVDIDGTLHQLYGFDEGRPGFVYVRPDNYVGSIGFLEELGKMS